jgi:hypothetical protein
MKNQKLNQCQKRGSMEGELERDMHTVRIQGHGAPDVANDITASRSHAKSEDVEEYPNKEYVPP